MNGEKTLDIVSTAIAPKVSVSSKRRKKKRRRSQAKKNMSHCQAKRNCTTETNEKSEQNSIQGHIFCNLRDSLFQKDGTISDRLNPKHKYFDVKFTEIWRKQLSKKQRRELAKVDKEKIEKETQETRNLKHKFQVNPDDHCETSAEAYADIAPLLRKYAALIGKTPSELAIYDPYFCAGSVKKHLGALGFENVYNRNEDFYEIIATKSVPK